jgi:ribosomal protein L37AE/L43A
MGQELTQVLCPECGTAGESDPGLSWWQCTKCGNGIFLRRCSACSRVSYVDGLQGIRMPWPCTWCGRFNKGFNQNQDPAAATAAELADEIARFGSASSGSPPDQSRAPACRPGHDGDHGEPSGP